MFYQNYIKKRKESRKWWLTPVFPALESLRQEDHLKFEACLACIVFPEQLGLQSETLVQGGIIVNW